MEYNIKSDNMKWRINTKIVIFLQWFDLMSSTIRSFSYIYIKSCVNDKIMILCYRVNAHDFHIIILYVCV